jgi:hypothetical protein
MDEPDEVGPERPPDHYAEPEWSGIAGGQGGFAGRVRLKADKLHTPADADERWEAPDDSWSTRAEEVGEEPPAPRGLGARLKRFFGRA